MAFSQGSPVQYNNYGVTGGIPNAILSPSPTKSLSGTNYVPTFDYNGADGGQFAPEVLEQEVNRFGDGTFQGFLAAQSAMIPFASSEIIWSEQTRLHRLYTDVDVAARSTNSAAVTINDNLTGNAIDNHTLRVGNTVHIQQEAGKEAKGVVTAIQTTGANAAAGLGRPTVFFYEDGLDTGAQTACTLRIYGSEFAKGTTGMEGSIEATYELFRVNPIIFKDHYKINGTDTTQIGWLEGVTEEGNTGYMWYLKSKSQTMLRWNDYLESGLVEGVRGNIGGDAGGVGNGQDSYQEISSGAKDPSTPNRANQTGYKGTPGLFYQIEDRGLVFSSFFDAAIGSLAASAITQYDTDIEQIIFALEKQAALKDYLWYINRKVDLNTDKWLATKNGPVTQVQNGTSAATNPGEGVFTKGTNYGDFGMTGDQMMKFGFKGFMWGGYNFAKTDWKYLNDPVQRGAMGDINGLMLPTGSTSVYDENLGSTVARPFVYVGYRTAGSENRLNKYWMTGSVGGVYTDDEDAMKIHMLSERAIVVQAANNLCLLKD